MQKAWHSSADKFSWFARFGKCKKRIFKHTHQIFYTNLESTNANLFYLQYMRIKKSPNLFRIRRFCICETIWFFFTYLSRVQTCSAVFLIAGQKPASSKNQTFHIWQWWFSRWFLQQNCLGVACLVTTSRPFELRNLLFIDKRYSGNKGPKSSSVLFK